MLRQASNVIHAPWEEEGLEVSGMKLDFVVASCCEFGNEGMRGKRGESLVIMYRSIGLGYAERAMFPAFWID